MRAPALPQPLAPRPYLPSPGAAARAVLCCCRSGADAGIKNAEGKTAGEVAEMNEQESLVALLKERAAAQGEGQQQEAAKKEESAA